MIEIPVVPIRRVARLGSGHTPSRQHPEYWENCTIPWLTLADVGKLRDGIVTVVDDTAERISELGVSHSAAVVHPTGTVALSRTASVGFTCILGTDMATSQDFATWACGPLLEPRFLLYALRGNPRQIKQRMIGSTHKTIYMPDIETLTTPLPAIDDQRAIVDFLDAETARIDSLVDRERLLAELSEERLAALTQRVLLPAASILSQDSGAELPSGWQSFRLKMLLREVTDLSTEGSEELLSVSHITGVTPRSEKRVTMTMAESLEGYKRVAVNDFVVNTLWAWMGAVGVSKHSGIVSPAYGVYRPFSPQLEPRYLDYFARTRPFIDLMTLYSKGVWSSRLRLYADELLGLRVALPPSVEQLRLVAVFDQQARRAESVRNLVGRSIELLTERKQALITAAVAGQLDLAREISEEAS